jgi:peptidoglycan hydrolase-like protein with peptidoglycan-binding domain
MSLTRTLQPVAPRSGLGTNRLDPPLQPAAVMVASTRSRRHASLALVAVIAALLLLATSAEWSRAAVRFPITEYGSRGANVAALQYLLRYRGYDLPVTGWYGPQTLGSVRSFQRRAGLTASGWVDGRTWLRMAPDVIVGMRGHHVHAVQVLLNAKFGSRLRVDGTFGTATEAAVAAFQRVHRMEPDGGVGPLTWTRLVAQFTQPAFARPAVCPYPTAANGHRAHYGTSSAVGAMHWVGEKLYAGRNGPVSIGDISYRYGGQILGHRLHRYGLEVDIRPMRRDNAQCSYGSTWYRWSGGRKVCCSAAYDRAATRALIISLRSSGLRIREIAFNDPALVKEGLTRYYGGHDDHVHVTFCERAHPDPYYRC